MLFVDANAFLSLYDDRITSYKELLPSLPELRDYIFITEQIVNEVNRNKYSRAKQSFASDALVGTYKFHPLPSAIEEADSGEIGEINSKLLEIRDAVKQVHSRINSVRARTLDSIAKSQDAVSEALAPLFQEPKRATEQQLAAARLRKETGNPPGKPKDPLGDQISWEQLLDEYDGGPLWIVTNDKDYLIDSEKELILDPFLYLELRERNQGREPEVHIFKSLSGALKDYRSKVEVRAPHLPSQEVLEEINRQEEQVLKLDVETHNWLHKILDAPEQIRYLTPSYRSGPKFDDAWAMSEYRFGNTFNKLMSLIDYIAAGHSPFSSDSMSTDEALEYLWSIGLIDDSTKKGILDVIAFSRALQYIRRSIPLEEIDNYSSLLDSIVGSIGQK